MGKSYKDFNQTYIGTSDYSKLVTVGCGMLGNVHAEILGFGEDNDYYAYVVDDSATIGEHYIPVFEYYNWMKMYDDNGLVNEFNAKRISVYRAGKYGCIIQLIN